MERKYELVATTIDDINFIKDAKITTIFDYAQNISEEECAKILSYVDRYVAKFLNEYKIISKDGQRCGVVLIRNFEDGFLLDEIYLLAECRNMGIGTDIIKNAKIKYPKIYLWVYKDNKRAIKLYKSLGFNIIDDKNQRYFMVYTK